MHNEGRLQHSETDEAIVRQQLGRPVRGSWTVARRCHLGIPMAIENHPRLPDGSPFPTLFWLTCPVLVKTVSRLEAAGVMQTMSDDLTRERAYSARLQDAMDRYRARRDSHEVVDDKGAFPGGGPERVKCLHAHVAHELGASPNPVGARALAQTGWPECRRPCVEAGA